VVAQATELPRASGGTGGATASRVAQHSVLDSIDSSLLTTVTGAGLSLGDRNPAPENPNSWAPSIDRAVTENSNGYRGAIDPGMVRMPENPKMDSGIWQGMGDTNTASSSPLDI
jgi:hypothetical protein